MKSTTTRSLALLWALLILLSSASCGAAAGQPEEEYRAAMEALYRGDLWAFYSRLAPPSYTRDLNALLDKSKTLMQEDEYREALGLIEATAERLRSQLNSLPDPPPQADVIAVALQDVPASLGIETWDQFQQADVESLIRNLQQSSIGEALRHPQSPVEWSRQKVDEIVVEGDTATLRVLPAEGPGEVKAVELVKVDEKWVPANVARQWDERLKSANARLDGWIEAKERNPDYVKERLQALRQQLDLIAALIPALLLQMQEMEQR